MTIVALSVANADWHLVKSPLRQKLVEINIFRGNMGTMPSCLWHNPAAAYVALIDSFEFYLPYLLGHLYNNSKEHFRVQLAL
jgi:hypothetical protein